MVDMLPQQLVVANLEAKGAAMVGEGLDEWPQLPDREGAIT